MTKFYDADYSFERVRGYQFVKLYISMFEKWLESPQWLLAVGKPEVRMRVTSAWGQEWVRSRNCGCLVTRFCYQMIAKPGNKTAAPSWTDPYIQDPKCVIPVSADVPAPNCANLAADILLTTKLHLRLEWRFTNEVFFCLRHTALNKLFHSW